MEEEDKEAKKKRLIQPPLLEPMSIEALGDYIAEMEAEIARVREAVATKKDARSEADSFFKS